MDKIELLKYLRTAIALMRNTAIISDDVEEALTIGLDDLVFPKPKKTFIATNLDLDYSDCYYEGDEPHPFVKEIKFFKTREEAENYAIQNFWHNYSIIEENI